MKAAVVHDFAQPPRYADFARPEAGTGEVLIHVRAAALSQLVRAQAAGRHYSSKTLPFVPGADGVGCLENGERVYFAFPQAPLGAMAEQTVVKAAYCTPLPAALDDISAAAMANPGMSSWAALQYRAHFQPGESVLINGAAGASGRLAIQIARHLGAGRIIATARQPAVVAELCALGADSVILLHQDSAALTAAFQREIHERGVDIVLDYLWGPPAACLLQAAASHGESAAHALRFVNIGGLAGAELALPAGLLRGSGLQLCGSGLGSVALADLVSVTGQMLQAAATAGWRINSLARPLREVNAAWGHDGRERLVFTLP